MSNLKSRMIEKWGHCVQSAEVWQWKCQKPWSKDNEM